ncbi:MAG: ABC transporter permease subunit, partial [Gammaproteobacteria bacterium]|nr:ABC transporter permease subunit [Gammaproteobacteria bacterium]
MTWEIFRFECRYQLHSPLFLIVSMVFFLFNFFAMASESVTVGGGAGNLNLNASFIVIQTQYVFSIIGMFAAIAFVAGAITRDYEAKTAELFFASGVSEKSYLFGRFAGGFLFATLAVLVGFLGTLIATFMPWLDPERIGVFDPAPYWFGIYGVIVPNMFVVCALFFSVAALTRSILASYVAALAFMITFVVLSAVTDQESLSTVALADPFGITAFGELTRYWTVFDRNYQVPEFTGTLLTNRLIWGTFAVLALLATAARYGFNLAPSRFRLWRPKRKKTSLPAPVVREVLAQPRFSFGTSVFQFISQLRMDIRGIVRSVPFYV